MRKIATLFTMLLLFAGMAFGQNRWISGIVTDESGAPVAGASVRIKGTTTGVAADNSGQFRLLAKTGDVLVISGANIDEIEYPVGTGNSLSIKVTTKTKTETEVVVTAMGVQRQKRELGYSTTSIKNEALTQAAPVNALAGIAGKVSGVNVAIMDNSVFENIKVNLRGIRSLTGNNNPLLVVDGVQVPFSFLGSINPNDIADYNILKGASAAAIYGPEGRNGAFVITTKRGTKADRAEVTVGQTTQFSRISFFPKFQEEFGSGGYGEYIEYENWSWGPRFDGSVKPLGSALKDGTQQEVPYIANDSRKKFFNTAITTQTDVSVNAKDLFISIQDVNLKGIVPGDKNRRTGLRLNSSKSFGKFSVNLGLNYIRGDYKIFDDVGMADYNSANNVGLNSGLLNLIFNTPAHVPLTNYKNWRTDPFSGFNTYFNHYGLNPYMAIDTWRQIGNRNDLLGNLELNYKLIKDLDFTWRIATQVRNSETQRYSTGQVADPATNVNTNTTISAYDGESSARSTRLSSEVFGKYKKVIKDFKLDVLAGTYVRQSDARTLNVGNTGLVVPNLFTVSNRVGELTGSSPRSKSRLFALFGSVGIGYKNWAYVEFTGRNEVVSWLDPNNRSYFYPGVSGSLVLTDMIPAIKNDIVNYAKLRLAWNKTANADLVGQGELSPLFGVGGGFPFGTIAGYTAANSVTDPLISPEFITNKEVGLELSLFKNKVSLGVSYYDNDMDDQLVSVAVSSATGYTSTKVNAASFTNNGVEFDLGLTPLVKMGDWKVNINANASYNNSNVTGIYPGLDRVFVGGFGNAANYALEGYPAMVFMVRDYNRDNEGRIIVDRSTGLPTVNPTLVRKGRTAPTWTGGITPTISWKGVSLTVVAEYKTGHIGYGRIGSEMAWTGVSAATAYNGRERFVIPNSVYEDPANPGKYLVNNNITINDVTDFYTGIYRQAETNFLYDASSWRIREASLSYDLPKKWFGNSKFIKGGSISVNGRNLFLWVPKSNQYTDPDFNFDGGNSNGVTTSSINPPTRTMGFSVNLSL